MSDHIPLNIVHTESSCGWGGQEIRILQESLGFIARGHQVRILCVADSPLHRAAARQNVPVTSLPIAKKTLSGLLAARTWIKRHQPDIINTHSSTDSWLFSLAAHTLSHRPALVRTRHLSTPVANTFLNRWLYGQAFDQVVTTGKQLRQTLVSQKLCDPTRIFSVPTGIDIDHFKPGDRASARQQCQLPPHAWIIGIVATMRSWKGHRYLMEAFKQLALPDAFLLIVGDGPQRDALQQQAETFGLSEKIIFAGNQEDVAPWLRAMDIFVLPSYANEGVPQSLMQAMACGIPVITTSVGSISELVVDKTTGLIIPLQDPNAITHACLQLKAEPHLYQKLREQARMHIEKYCSLTLMVDAMERVFYQALSLTPTKRA